MYHEVITCTRCVTGLSNKKEEKSEFGQAYAGPDRFYLCTLQVILCIELHDVKTAAFKSFEWLAASWVGQSNALTEYLPIL